MRWKLIILGGLAFYVTMTILDFAVIAPVIHNNLLKAEYKAHSELWRPELNEEPPDMAGLMKRWVPTGILGAFIMAFVYSRVRPALKGPGWRKGMEGGFWLGLLNLCFGLLGVAGVFNASDKIWIWWGVCGFVEYMISGAVLGWVGEKIDPA